MYDLLTHFRFGCKHHLTREAIPAHSSYNFSALVSLSQSVFLHNICKTLLYTWASQVAQWCKESICQCRRHRFNPWVGKIPWRIKQQPSPVFLPGKLHGQWSLVGYSPWGRKRVRHDLVTEHHHHHWYQQKNELSDYRLILKWTRTQSKMLWTQLRESIVYDSFVTHF